MTRLHLHRPARYRIVVGSHVGGGESMWQPSFVVYHCYSSDGVPITRLEGVLPDQAALHGFLAQIRDKGLPLYLASCLDFEDFSDHRPEK